MASSNALSYLRRKTNRYVRNVGKSVGYVAIEDIKPQSTVISQLYKDAKELSKNLKANSNARKAAANRNRTMTTSLSASANKQKRGKSEFSKNLISDLKTGKWYNKGRMDNSASDMFDFGLDADNYTGVSFNFDDDFGDGLYNDETGTAGQPSPTKSSSTISRAFMQTGMNISTATVEATARSAEYIAESNNLAAKAIYDSMNFNFGQVIVGLDAINTNIQTVQASVNETLNTHAINSAKFYIDSSKYQQESLDLLRKIATGVDAINSNTAPSSASGARRSGKEYSLNNILRGSGIPDFKALAANAKKGFKEEFIPNLLLMLGLGGDVGGSGGGLASNPIGIITSELLRMLGVDIVPRGLKSGVRNINNTLRNLLTGGLVRARGFDFRNVLNRNNPITNFTAGILNDIKKAILPKSNYSKINTGNYNKRKVDWDGIARKSLVEVIPTQLGKILSALTGENEMRYDFEHGRWIDTHKALSDLRNLRRNEKVIAGGDFLPYATSLVQNNNRMSSREKARMGRVLEDFNAQAYRSAGTSSELDYLILIDPKRRIDSHVMEIANRYGIKNQTELRNLRNLAAAMRTTSVGRNAINSYGTNLNIARDIEGANNRYKEYINNPTTNMFVDESYSFGNAAVAKTKASAIGSRANWTRNKGNSILSAAVDQYNHDVFFYLQGIFQYTKHVSDNLPLLIGGTGGKKTKVKGVKISQVRGIEPIADDTIEEVEAPDLGENEEVNRLHGNTIGEISSSNAIFDPLMDDTLKQHVALRTWAISNGMYDNLMRTNNEFKENEEKLKKYGNRPGNGMGGSIRNLINKSKIGRTLTKGYDGFINVLEAIGGSREDLQSALGFFVPNQLKGLGNQIRGNQHVQNMANRITNARNRIVNSNFARSNLDADFLASLPGYDENYINPNSARGRKVTKTGIVSVSEGELIIPSELNPYYHGITNKKQQIRDEQRAVQQYFGSYAKGGMIVRRPDALSLKQLYQQFRDKGMSKELAFKRAKEVIKSFENKFNSGKRGEQIEARGVGKAKGIDINGMINGATGKVRGAFDTVGEGLVNIFGPRNAKEAEAEKKKIGDLVNGMFEDFGVSKSGMVTGAVLGGGVSLLTGAVVGPILGASIGAATGLIVKSNKVQKALFGEEVEELDENGKPTGKTTHKGGLLPEKISNFMKKNVPSMAKGTGLGVLAGAALFGSPVIGAIVGAATGFAQSSDKVKDALFGKVGEDGEREGGLVSKKIQQNIKRAVPNIAAGAALGALFGPLGPAAGGLAGNIILGSALGFATSTNKFQDWLYGKDDGHGNRTGGFADKIKKELFDPITKGFLNLTNIASQQFKNLSKSLAKSAREFMFKHVMPALFKTNIGKKLAGAGRKLAKGAWGLITAPGKGLLRHTRKKALNRGYTIEGMTSQERLALRESGELGYNYGMYDTNEGYVMDKLLGTTGSNEERQALLNAINDMESAHSYGGAEDRIKHERQKAAEKIRDIYKEAKLDPKDARELNKLYNEIAMGNIDKDDVETIRERLRIATRNRFTDPKTGANYNNGSAKQLMDIMMNISDDMTIRNNAITDSKSKLVELIDKNSSLNTKEKDLLKKKLLSGNTKDIEFVKGQLGIDIKAGQDDESGRTQLSSAVEKAITTEIPNKITKIGTDIVHALNAARAARTGEDLGMLDAKAGLDTSESKAYYDKWKEYGDTLEDISRAKRYEQYKKRKAEGMTATEAMEDIRENSFARGGIARRGLAAVSKGELILPRNFLGSFAEGNIDNPDIDSKGEDNVVRGQHGNIEENLGSKAVQDRRKKSGSFFDAMKSIPVGFAAMNQNLNEIKEALVGGYQEGKNEKKSGLLSMLSDAFFGGAKSKIMSLVSGAIKIAAPILAGVFATKLAVAISQGKFDKVGEKIGYGEASHKGDTYMDQDGDIVTKDASGAWVKEDGTEANGKIEAVNSETNDPMSDRFNYNLARGIVTGTGTAAGAMVKGAIGMTRSGKGLMKAAGKAGKFIASKAGGIKVGKGKDMYAAYKAAKAGGKTAQEAMKEINKSSALLGIREGLINFAAKIKKVPVIGKCKFVDKIDDICAGLLDFVEKKSLGSAAKTIGSIAKTAAVVIGWAMVVADCITGWQDAEKILGIKKATNAQKFGCAIGRALLRAIPFIGTFLPEKKIIQFIFKYLPGGEKLAQQQDEMQQEVDDYNEANGTNYSVDEYLTKVEGKQNFIDWTGNKIKTFGANLFNKNKSTESDTSGGGSGAYMGSYAEGGIVGQTSGVASLIDNASGGTLSTVGARVTGIADKIKKDVEKGDIKAILLDAGKIGLGVTTGTLLPTIIGPALVNGLINKITGTSDVNQSGNSSKLTTAFNTLKDMIDAVKNGDPDKIKDTKLGSDSGLFSGVFYFLKNMFTLGAYISKGLKWLTGGGEEDTKTSTGSKVADTAATILIPGYGLVKGIKALGTALTGGDESSGSGSGFISQFDPRYRGRRLGGKSIADNGCGPAAAVMAINQMNSMSGSGTSMDAAINHASRYQTRGGTDAAYFADEFARNGYKARYITNRTGMLQNIASGRPTILMGNAGMGSKAYTPFGPNNHYVVANGMDARGNIIISDPEQGGARAYNPSILRQVRLGVAGGKSGEKLYDEEAYNKALAEWEKNRNDYSAWATEALIQGYEMDPITQTPPPDIKDFPLENSATKPASTSSNIKNTTGTNSNTKYTYTYTKDPYLSNYYSITGVGNMNKTTGNIAPHSYTHGGIKTYGSNVTTIPGVGIMDNSTSKIIDGSYTHGAAVGTEQRSRQSFDSNGMTMSTASSSPYTYTAAPDNIASSAKNSINESTNKYEGMSILSAITSIFGDALGNLFGMNKGSSDSSAVSLGTTEGMINALSATTGKDPVGYMEDILGTIDYEYGGNNVEGGKADCSATVRWAYQKATGFDIGRTSRNQANNTKYFDIVYDAGGKYKFFTKEEVEKMDLMRNDLLFFFRDKYVNGDIGHVGLYMGNGKYIDHGSGKGPQIKTLIPGSRAQGLTRICRLKKEWAEKLAAEGQYSVSNAGSDTYGQIVQGSNKPALKSSTVINNMNEAYAALNNLNLGTKKTNFYSKILEGSLQGKKDYGVPPSITMAQAAIESGWGESGLTRKANNLFGMKTGSSWTGNYINMNTGEQNKDGSRYTVNAAFRAYDDWNQSVNDHNRLLGTADRYKGILNTDYATAANALGNSGYATSLTYGNTIRNQIEADKLYEFDNFAASGSGIYNKMGSYIRRNGLTGISGGASQTTELPKYVTAPGVNRSNLYTPGTRNRSANNYTTIPGVGRISRSSNTNDPTLSSVVNCLIDIVKELSDQGEDIAHVTDIYNMMVDDHKAIEEGAKGSGSKQLKDSYIPKPRRSNEQIASSLSELKAQVSQIVV